MDAFFARAVREVPNLCVGTDMMVGFQVKRMLILSKPAKLSSMVHLPTVMYLPILREGTPAAKPSEQVPMEKPQALECSFTPAFGIQENGLPFALSR